MDMFRVHREHGYDFYTGIDSRNGKKVYNIALDYQKKPTGGYYSKEHIEKVKGVSFPEGV